MASVSVSVQSSVVVHIHSMSLIVCIDGMYTLIDDMYTSINGMYTLINGMYTSIVHIDSAHRKYIL